MGTRDCVQSLAYYLVKNFYTVNHMSMFSDCKINCPLACSNRLVSDMYFRMHLDMATFEGIGKVSSPNKSTFRVEVVYCDKVRL